MAAAVSTLSSSTSDSEISIRAYSRLLNLNLLATLLPVATATRTNAAGRQKATPSKRVQQPAAPGTSI